MGIRISEMEEAASFGEEDLIPIVKDGSNKKALGSKIKDFIAGFFVSKSGDTMTGALQIDGSRALMSKDDRLNETSRPTANRYNALLTLKDTNDNAINIVQGVQTTDGTISLLIGAQRHIGSTTKYNTLRCNLDESGNASYAVTDAAAFRSAIELNIIRTTSVSGTTSSNGNATTSLNISDYIPIYFNCDNLSVMHYFGTSSGGKIAIHFTDTAGNNLYSTAISGTLYYVKISDLIKLLVS